MLLNPQFVKTNAELRGAKIIFIKERNISMLKNELILKNPLRRMGYESDDILNKGQFGAVLASWP